jgi:predicted phosphoribosyltransferase
MGAIASGGVRVINEGMLQGLRVPNHIIDEVVKRELRELNRRENVYRAGLPAINVSGQVVILVDDGLATGSTMRAAALALQKQDPKRLVVAVPVGAPQTCDEFRSEVDEIICAVEPDCFHAVGLWYEDFSQTTDEEVQQLLDEASQWNSVHASGSST